MSNKLKDEVNRISMSPEMKERILHNIISKETKKRLKKHRLLRNSLEFTAACCTFLLCIQIIKSNPQLFKINYNNEIKKESVNNNGNSVNNKNDGTKQSSSVNVEVSKNDKINTDSSVVYEKSNSENSNKVNNSKNSGSMKATENIQSNLSKSNEIIDNNDNLENNKNNDAIVQDNKSSEETSNNDEIVCSGNPISEFKTIKDAKKVLNFTPDISEDIDKYYEIFNITVISGKIISIDFKDKDTKFTYRESIYCGEDISGDYNEYVYKSSKDIYGTTVSLKGNSEGLINLAEWNSNGKVHFICSQNGIKDEIFDKMINEFIEKI